MPQKNKAENNPTENKQQGVRQVELRLKYKYIPLYLGVLEDDIDSVGKIDEKIFTTNQWSDLVDKALLADPEQSKNIVAQHPDQIANVIHVLKKLDKFFTDIKGRAQEDFYLSGMPENAFRSDSDNHTKEMTFNKAANLYKNLDVKKPIKLLLLQLKTQHEPYYRLTAEDKKIIKNEMEGELSRLKSNEERENFFNEHSDDLHLYQHRNPFFDAIRGKKDTKSWDDFNKLKKTHLLNTNSTKSLDNKIAELEKILQDKYSSLLRQENYCKFYASYKSNNKIKALKDNLQKLQTEDFNNFREFEVFVDKLLENKDLNAHRGFFGIGNSDTYLKLRAFHDKTFSSCNPKGNRSHFTNSLGRLSVPLLGLQK